MDGVRRLELEHLWRPQGWLSPAWIEIDAAGNVRSVASQKPDGAVHERLNGYALPGLPNLHSHAFQRAMAGLAEHAKRPDESFWTWRNAMYSVADRIEPDDLEAIAGALYAEMLEAGYTSVVEFQYLHRARDGALYAEPAELSLRIARAAERVGIGLTLVPVLYRSAGFGAKPADAGQRRFVLSVEELCDVARRVADAHAGVRVGIAPHSLRAVPPAELAALLESFEDRTAPVHIHVAEQTREVEECVATHGARPVEWLLHNAPLDRRWCLVHATHVTRAELEGVARSGAVIGLCPTTEANLGDGVFPLPDWLDLGGAWGIGSDSHISVNAVEELRWLEYGQRLKLRRRNISGSAALLYGAALEGGALASGRTPSSLEPGARADLFVLDGEHPALAERPLDRVLDAWIFASNCSAVKHVLTAGIVRVRDGRHVEHEALQTKFRAALRGLA